MSEKTYRIKPLEWESSRDGYHEEFWSRPLGLCYFLARRRENCEKRWTHWRMEIRDYSGSHAVGPFGYYYDRPPETAFRTIDDAKAAAEAHWRETITRFLEEVTHD